MFDIEAIDSAWKAHRNFAEWLVKELNPKVIVELGVHFGYSLCVFAKQTSGKVYGIDNFLYDTRGKDVLHEVRKTVIANSLDNVTLIKGDFIKIGSSWKEKSIDILHLDGDHTYEQTKEVFDVWFDCLKDSGVMLFHDTISFPDGVGKFFKELSLPKFNIEKEHGLGVLCKKSSTLELIKKGIDL